MSKGKRGKKRVVMHVQIVCTCVAQWAAPYGKWCTQLTVPPPRQVSRSGAPCVSNHCSIDARSVYCVRGQTAERLEVRRSPPTGPCASCGRLLTLYPAEQIDDGFQRDDSRGPIAKQARGRRVNKASAFENDWRARRRTWPGTRKPWHGGIMWHCESGERPASHPAALAGSPQYEQSCLQWHKTSFSPACQVYLQLHPPFTHQETHSHPPSQYAAWHTVIYCQVKSNLMNIVLKVPLPTTLQPGI